MRSYGLGSPSTGRPMRAAFIALLLTIVLQGAGDLTAG